VTTIGQSVACGPLRAALFLAGLGGLFACQGRVTGLGFQIGAPESPANPAPAAGPVTANETFGRGATGIQRLTRREYNRSLRLLLDVDLTREIESTLPPDNRTPFDNDYARQEISKPLIEGYQSVAEEAAAKVLADGKKLARVVGCTPKNQADADCFGQFLKTFGRRALRRPLSSDETSAYAALLKSPAAEGKFDLAVGLVLRSMLQSLDFLYRSEIGDGATADATRLELTPYELATRLSFTLWGEGPDDTLLEAAENGMLTMPGGLKAQATRLIDAPQGRAHVSRFHAQLWQYESMQISGAIAGPLRTESDALVERVVFEKQSSWFDLFRSKQTYVNGALREHYGLPLKPNADFEWVDYPRPEQMGILSHGSVLSNGVSGNDTSPVFRGKFIREHMLCQRVPPPPTDVMATLPKQTEGLCKPERLAAHSGQEKCASCHKLMDGIGFGLEAFDAAGRFRETEFNRPDCKISGQGEFVGVGNFTGPAGLASLLLQDEKALSQCMLEGLYGYTIGRTNYSTADTRNIEALALRFSKGAHNMRQLLIDWVSDDTFRFRDVDQKD
jgi:Protein of unknown function (DUF1588)/Protein of unknown function (DUF1592)/Protein of unknown function (DUF1595)/Protein of unknown function (DUF1587)/Protein of unknown function (DUF1585)